MECSWGFNLLSLFGKLMYKLHQWELPSLASYMYHFQGKTIKECLGKIGWHHHLLILTLKKIECNSLATCIYRYLWWISHLNLCSVYHYYFVQKYNLLILIISVKCKSWNQQWQIHLLSSILFFSLMWVVWVLMVSTCSIQYVYNAWCGLYTCHAGHLTRRPVTGYGYMRYLG